MGIGDRPATCTSCGKRLNRKSWYYRNGKYFCKRRCWVTESAKVAGATSRVRAFFMGDSSGDGFVEG